MRIPLFVALAVICSLPTYGLCRESEPQGKKSADEVAKELANPNNSLASLTSCIMKASSVDIKTDS